MPHYYLVVIRRDGEDGPRLPLDIGSEYTVGSKVGSHVMLKPEFIPTVEERTATITLMPDDAILLSNDCKAEGLVRFANSSQPVRNNTSVKLRMGEVFEICGRKFRMDKVDTAEERARRLAQEAEQAELEARRKKRRSNATATKKRAKKSNSSE